MLPGHIQKCRRLPSLRQTGGPSGASERRWRFISSGTLSLSRKKVAWARALDLSFAKCQRACVAAARILIRQRAGAGVLAAQLRRDGRVWPCRYFAWTSQNCAIRSLLVCFELTLQNL